MAGSTGGAAGRYANRILRMNDFVAERVIGRRDLISVDPHNNRKGSGILPEPFLLLESVAIL